VFDRRGWNRIGSRVDSRVDRATQPYGAARVARGARASFTARPRRRRETAARNEHPPSSQTWRTFLANHAHHLWAADLLTVQTLTFKTLYVLVFIAHGRRELVHVNVTANPTAAWVWRRVIEATPWGNTPRHLLRDRDAVYGRDFRQRARRIGIDAIATPVASPRANAIAERVIGTLRRECLDHLIILDEQHLRSVLTEFVQYYNLERPHRTLRLETPLPSPRPVEGPVRSRPVLDGLHHVYERAT
jgi:transposase InsO family protein